MTNVERISGAARGRCRATAITALNGLVWSVATAQGKGANVAEQTAATLAVLDRNLADAGTDKTRIVEATIYLTDMAAKAEMDAVWCAWIPDGAWPCRACIGTALAPGDLIEIKVTAVR